MANTEFDLEKLHETQLEIAKEIKRVCEMNNTRYFLTFGSLLGAIRSDGFIPWDDDMDIGILREDYDLFLEAFKQHGDTKRFFLETWDENGYPFPFAKVKKNGTLYVGHAIKNADIHKGIFVDVFPYDKVPDNQSERAFLASRIALYQKLLKFKLKYLPINPNSKMQHIVAHAVRMIGVFIPKRYLQKKIETIEMKYVDTDDRYVACVVSPYKLRDAVPVSCYDEFEMHKFENEFFQIPKGYDEILRSIYGNYMKLPPEEERHPRHYPEKIKYE